MSQYIPFKDFYSKESIVHAYLDGQDLTRFIPKHFTDLQSYRNLASEITTQSFLRDLVSSVLMEQNEIYQAGKKTFGNINDLNKSDTLVVVGGQQTGLFGGPLYTLYKAITVIKLAEFLSSKIEQTVVPIFWMASDDHDFAEVNHIHLPDLSGQQIERISYGQESRKIPVSELIFSDEIGDKIQSLNSILPETEFRSDILNRLESAYRQDHSFPVGFAIWLQCILQDYGLIVVDASDSRLKKAAIPLFQKEIEEQSPVSKAVIDQTEDLVSSGYSPQLRLSDGFLNLFYHNPQRETIAFSDGKWTLKNTGQQFTKSELINILEEHPEKFSPNAAFRPLYQDSLFPTLAIVLGPSEIAYFAQLKKAYESMDVTMPIAFPRTSATLLEPRAERILKKYSLSIQDIYKHKDKIVNVLIEQQIPQYLFSKIDEEEKTVGKIWDNLGEEFTQFDQNLRKTSEIAKGRSVSQFDFMRKKLKQSARQKDEVLQSQCQKLLSLLYPNNTPQERIFNLLPYYIRYGDRFIEILFEKIDIFNPNHQIINLTQD